MMKANTVITVNSGQGSVANQLRRVIVTPISALSQDSTSKPTHHHIEKVLLKAVHKGSKKAKKEPKTFTLRNIDTIEVCSSDKLKHVIKTQLKDDIVMNEEDFEVGVFQGTNIVSIRSKEDMMDVCKDMKKGDKIVLWCDGLRTLKRKRRETPQTDEDDSDESRTSLKTKRAKKAEEREDKVHDTIKKLKAKHGSLFSPMQLRIWSEMVVGEIYSRLDEPPSTSMFAKAGNPSTTKKKDQCSTSQALTEAVTAIASALSPPPPKQGKSGCGQGSSPAKLIDGRSKCYKQLSELNNLKVSGIISDEEYVIEKEAIMAILNTLKTSH